MLWLLVPGVVMPLIYTVPLALVFWTIFPLHLYAMRRVHFWTRTASFSLLEPRVQASLNEKIHGIRARRTHYITCAAEVTILAGLPFFLFQIVEGEVRVTLYALLLTQAMAVVISTLYAPWYHSAAEVTGEWTWQWLRFLKVWRYLHAYFGVTAVYMKQPPGDLAMRDERRMQMRKSGKSKVAAQVEMERIDRHAIQATYAEPDRFFTLDPGKYVRVLEKNMARLEYGEPEKDTCSRTHFLARPPRMYAVHPHGMSAVTMACLGVMPGPDRTIPDAENLRVCVANILFRIPIIREFVLLCGCIEASPQAMASNLARHRDLMIAPGGMLEQAITHYDHVDIVWTRFGFCNMALEYQASIIPVCAFGENATYWSYNAFPEWRLSNYARFGYAFPYLFVGPFPSRIVPSIGLPIETTRVHMTDASREYAENYNQRDGRRHHGTQKGSRRKRLGKERENSADVEPDKSTSDGDTPLVDLGKVAARIHGDGIIDTDREVCDYYGEGYNDVARHNAHTTSGGWFVYRLNVSRRELRRARRNIMGRTITHTPLLETLGADGDLEDLGHGDGDNNDDEFITLMSHELQDKGLLRAADVVRIQRAFYAQFVDLRDTLCFALPKYIPGISVERWGPSLDELRVLLKRDTNIRTCLDINNIQHM